MNRKCLVIQGIGEGSEPVMHEVKIKHYIFPLFNQFLLSRYNVQSNLFDICSYRLCNLCKTKEYRLYLELAR